MLSAKSSGSRSSDLRNSLGLSSLGDSLRLGSLAGNGLGLSGLGNSLRLNSLGRSSNAGSSLRGRCSSGGSGTAASGHTNSQSQSNNSNSNILEFHI